MTTEVRDLGMMDYHHAHELQLESVARQLAGDTGSEVVFITEHPPVFTLGRKGSLTSLIRNKADVIADGIDIIHTERGGDITYHGPGQLVVYPIINLRRRKISVTDFIIKLEDIMLRTSRDLGVSVTRDSRNRGVWVSDSKIGSVGIRVRHGITFHGLALNVNLSLTPFQWIEPCGLAGVRVTSLEKQLKKPVAIETTRAIMKQHIREILCD